MKQRIPSLDEFINESASTGPYTIVFKFISYASTQGSNKMFIKTYLKDWELIDEKLKQPEVTYYKTVANDLSTAKMIYAEIHDAADTYAFRTKADFDFGIAIIDDKKKQVADMDLTVTPKIKKLL